MAVYLYVCVKIKQCPGTKVNSYADHPYHVTLLCFHTGKILRNNAVFLYATIQYNGLNIRSHFTHSLPLIIKNSYSFIFYPQFACTFNRILLRFFTILIFFNYNFNYTCNSCAKRKFNRKSVIQFRKSFIFFLYVYNNNSFD